MMLLGDVNCPVTPVMSQNWSPDVHQTGRPSVSGLAELAYFISNAAVEADELLRHPQIRTFGCSGLIPTLVSSPGPECPHRSGSPSSVHYRDSEVVAVLLLDIFQ